MIGLPASHYSALIHDITLSWHWLIEDGVRGYHGRFWYSKRGTSWYCRIEKDHASVKEGSSTVLQGELE